MPEPVPVARLAAAGHGGDGAVGCDAADAVVGRVGHIHVGVGIHGHALRVVELGPLARPILVARAVAPRHGDGIALGVVDGCAVGRVAQARGGLGVGPGVHGVGVGRVLHVSGGAQVPLRLCVAALEAVTPAAQRAVGVVEAEGGQAVAAAQHQAHVRRLAAAEVVPVRAVDGPRRVVDGGHVDGYAGPWHALQLVVARRLPPRTPDLLATVALALHAPPRALVPHVLQVAADTALGLHGLVCVLGVGEGPVGVLHALAPRLGRPRPARAHGRHARLAPPTTQPPNHQQAEQPPGPAA